MSIWEDKEKLQEIRKLVCATPLSDIEFDYLVGIGRSTLLNPFLRELWAIKYGNSAAQIFIGRDGYRKAAQRHPDYDYHQADAVYSNDTFEMVNGEIRHSYSLKNRGELMGAYCIVKRHKATRSSYVYVELKEYSTGKSLWSPSGGKPATMIKKVAEAQALRAAFQDILAGTYAEEEIERSESKPVVIEGNTQTEKLKSILNVESDSDKQEVIIENEEENGNEPVTLIQMRQILTLMDKKGFDEERRLKAFNHFRIDDLADLTKNEAKKFLMQLERV